ncbi:hypothetical protein M3Y94_01298900 [Aphelenchoides besseyi]|nr:hypothetical protein M3Y94_01298900 [Aphelenchoides besseyi]
MSDRELNSVLYANRAAAERDERRRRAEEHRLEQEKRSLLSVFQERKLRFQPPTDLKSPEEFDLADVCIRSPYTQEMLQERVYVNPEDSNELVWPLLLQYVGMGQTDMIKAALAIAVEPQLTPFHYWENSVYDKVANILHNRREMLQLLRGLHVRPKNLHERKENAPVTSCEIQDIGAPANQRTFSYENTRLTVEEYFQRNRGIPLQHPEVPVLIAKYGPHRRYYPMEFGVNQIVKYAAVPPAHYQPRTEKMAKSANFSKSNFLRKAGIKVHDSPIKLKARVIAPPEMIYKGRRSQFLQHKGRWQPSAFILPALSPRTWAMCAFHAQGMFLNRGRLEQICDYYMAACRERGLRLINPSDCCVIDFDGGDRSKVFEEYLLEAVGNNCEFVIALTPKEDKQIHSFMKAFEQRDGIITQNVLLNTMVDATGIDKNGRGKRLAMENIVNNKRQVGWIELRSHFQCQIARS